MTLILALGIGGVGYFFARRRNHKFLALLLAGVLGLFSIGMNTRESVADVSYQVVLAPGGYADVTIPFPFVGVVSVKNPQNAVIIITDITVGSGFNIVSGGLLTVGSQIPA